MAIDKPDNEDVVTKPALAAFLESMYLKKS